ncbi:MAG: RNA polymerase sigma factor [Gemmatimonadaceae bacterium]
MADTLSYDGGFAAFPLPGARARPTPRGARRDRDRGADVHRGVPALPAVVEDDAGPRADEAIADAAGTDHAAPPDEAALVERARAGDASAFDELVRRYMARAFRIAYRLLGHREDAEDLVQDAFVRALEKIDTFERGRPFAPWFFRLLTNRGLNARKARALRQTAAVPEEAASPGESPLASAERADLRERLRAALEGLPAKQRLVVQMFEVEGRSSAEIAAALGMAEGTVRWHAHQARKVLRAALAPLQQSEER